jgi:hypothetical protein
MRQTLNGGESPYRFPESRDELLRIAFAAVCPEHLADIPLACYAGPAPVSQLPPFTEQEIDQALSALKG